MNSDDVGISLKRQVIESLGVLLVFGLLFAWKVLGSSGIFSIDAFYHFRIVRLMAAQGPVVDISWLPLTILGESGPDHHWLWHVLLLPFGWITNEELGLKLALVFNAAIVPTAFYFVCRRMRVWWPWLWTILLFAGGTSLLSRLLMLRTQNIAIVFLLLFLAFLVRRRSIALAVLTFVFFQSYHGAIIIFMPLGFFVLFDAWRSRRWNLSLVSAVVLGLAAALIISPWFPRNVEYLWFHTTFKLTNAQDLRVGTEWVRTPWRDLLAEAWFAHLLVISGVVGAFWKQRDDLKRPAVLTLIVTTLGTLLLYRFAHRFAEYYIPIATFTAAVLWARQGAPRLRIAASAVLLVIGLWRAGLAVSVYDDHRKSPMDIHAATVTAMREHIPSGSMVFNTHWDDFPYLLWQSTEYDYVNGLDPHYLAYSEPEIFETWCGLTGETRPPHDPIAAIREGIGTEWIVLRKSDRRFFEFLQQDSRAILLESNSWSSLFRLTP